MKKAIFIISALAIASLLGGLALSCSLLDRPYYTEDEICSAVQIPGLSQPIVSAEYQGDHVWRINIVGVEHHKVWVPPEPVPSPELDDSASLEEILEALRNEGLSEPGHYEWVRQDIEIKALFYERTGVVKVTSRQPVYIK